MRPMHSADAPRNTHHLATLYAAFGIFAFVATTANAQPKSGKTQPDRLTFGTVRVGATVEGSVRIFLNGDNTAGIQVKADPPPFVKVRYSKLGTQEYGNLGTFIVCDISVSLITSDAQDSNGPLRVQLGELKVEIPVTANVLPKTGDETRLLVVETPFQRFATDDATLYVPWLRIVEDAKLDCHYLEVDHDKPVLRELDLAQFDVIFMAQSGLVSANQADVDKLKQFILDGGRVVVAGNHFYRGTVESANRLLLPCGLQMTDAEPAGANLFEVVGSAIADHDLTNGVQTARFHRPSVITVKDETKGKILIGASENPLEGFVAIANCAKGEIVALGTSLWWNWISSEQEKDFDNAVLLKNLLTKPRKRP